MRYKMKSVVILFILIVVKTVYPHGYMLHPLARQYSCYKEKDFNWPEDGSGIGNEACRKAYQHVYKKYENNAAPAQYMFNQYAEYAALAGKNYKNITHIKNHVIPTNLCAAAANDSMKTYGDKTGVDLNLNTWHTTVFESSGMNRLYFCPTVVHEPSFFEVYITKFGYDHSNVISWHDLDLLYSDVSNLKKREESIKDCINDYVYVMDVNLPYRNKKFVIYTRWQREDLVGEGFYNCADAIYSRDEL